MEALMKYVKAIIYGFALGFISTISLSGNNGVNLDDNMLNNENIDALMSVQLPE